jgi:hypothetical protein
MQLLPQHLQHASKFFPESKDAASETSKSNPTYKYKFQTSATSQYYQLTDLALTAFQQTDSCLKNAFVP